jgi:hypothetical protein
VEPGLSIIGEQSIAQQRFKEVNNRGVFTIVEMVRLKYMLDIIGMKDHVGRPDQKVDRRDVAITLKHSHVKAKSIALDSASTSPE